MGWNNWVIQQVEQARDEAEALQMLKTAKIQMDFIAGRVLSPTNGHPWRVQVFYEDAPEAKWLPNGFSRCVTSTGFLERMAFRNSTYIKAIKDKQA